MAASEKSGDADTLLVELLTEELPPKALHTLGQTFANNLVAEVVKHRLRERDPAKRVFATPRRLAVLIPAVRAKALDSAHSVEGPPSSNAKAVEGFAKKHKVAPESLERRRTDKGEIVVANFSLPGADLEDVLANIIETTLKKLPIPKIMRWGAGDATFARPVHGLVMMHGSSVVAGKVLGIDSSSKTLGHRFLAGGAVALKHADDYERALLDKGKIIVDFSARRAGIEKQLQEAAGEAMLVVNDALLDEITAIVEAPAVYTGEFDSAFLVVPEECLILSMQQHQKYVPLREKRTEKLLPRFLFVSNIETAQPHEIIRGNERVLRARLADARFFYDQDRKTRLEARVPRLGSVVHHNKLGSQLERVERIQLLAGRIARELGADPLLAERTAWLSKADLLTDMVGEFPELQGTMGRYYALHDSEPQAVADAIEEHYRPRFAGDVLPGSAIGSVVALADKLDTLAGLFGIGQVPTGDRDPFGLRRAALGVIRILVEQARSVRLDILVGWAFDGFKSASDASRVALLEFVRERFAGYLRDKGYTTIEVDSVLETAPVRIDLVPRQLAAVRAFLTLPEADSLAAANKRVANILKQARSKGESIESIDPAKLAEPAEKKLFDALKAASGEADSLLKAGDFTGYLKAFSVLKSPVDAFFDSVMVMVDDQSLRRNRLALLADLRERMNRVADISRLAA
jgi:glycyl-tRNA synthetase beta chain